MEKYLYRDIERVFLSNRTLSQLKKNFECEVCFSTAVVDMSIDGNVRNVLLMERKPPNSANLCFSKIFSCSATLTKPINLYRGED